MKKSDIAFLFDTLQRMFPDSRTELVYETPFQLMVSVILSAQTTDKQVNKVTANLYNILRWPQDIITMWESAFTQAIKSIGLYTSKAKNIYKLCQIIYSKEYANQFKDTSKEVKNIYKKYGYRISDDIIQLQKLPWIGEKTAKVVAHVLYDIPVIAVDTHVHRVSNRLWLVATTQPLQTSKLLEKEIPDAYKQIAHHTLILFGRYHCMARKPKCETCPFIKFCMYYKQL